jgi:peptidylprolyl isomerase
VSGSAQKGAVIDFSQLSTLPCRVPPSYAYGDSGSPPKIPGKATLKFEVELLDFKPKQKEVWEMTTEERLAGAKTHKDAGNAAFKAKNLTEAIVQYEEVR